MIRFSDPLEGMARQYVVRSKR